MAPQRNHCALQFKVTEKRATLWNSCLTIGWIKFKKDVDAGYRKFWERRGMTPPLPSQAFDPFAGNKKDNQMGLRALKKVTT